MARVVQDSDDEAEDNLETDLPSPRHVDASEKLRETDSARHPHGTGSTESLQRAIEKAHRAHLQSQPSQNDPQSSVSLPEHPSKKRKTSIDVAPNQSPIFASPKVRGPVTYGRKSKSPLSSPSMGLEVDKHAGYDAIAAHRVPDEAPWNLQGTLREDYARHDPVAMFPEPSSTVPNATLTQQHILDKVNAPVLLGQDSEADAPHYIPPPPSVPWSDILKSPTEASDQTEPSDRVQPPSALPSATPLRISQKDNPPHSSQCSRRGSLSVCLKGSPLQIEVIHPEVEQREHKPLPTDASATANAEAPRLSAAQSLRNAKAEIQPASNSTQFQPTTVLSSDDDFAAIGIPKEQYKPRPSRSRSLKIDDEPPIDYSKRPEKARKISKRRKTTSTIIDTHAITTPEKVRQICDMGFTPSTTTRALRQNGGDVIQTVDWLVSNGVGDDELAPHYTPKTKPTPEVKSNTSLVDSDTIQVIMRNLNDYRKDETENSPNIAKESVAGIAARSPESAEGDTRTTAIEEPQDAVHTVSPTKVQVVISRNSPKYEPSHVSCSVNPSIKKAKRRKTTLDQPDPEPIVATPAAPEAVVEKKRGRGRPKKAANAKALTEATPKAPQKQELEVQVERREEDSPDALRARVPEGKQEDMEGIPSPDSQHLSADKMDNEPYIETALPITVAASPAPERSTRPASPSPVAKGKVPYRVGLSKRARIAPLLRTIKK